MVSLISPVLVLTLPSSFIPPLPVFSSSSCPLLFWILPAEVTFIPSEPSFLTVVLPFLFSTSPEIVTPAFLFEISTIPSVLVTVPEISIPCSPCESIFVSPFNRFLILPIIETLPSPVFLISIFPLEFCKVPFSEIVTFPCVLSTFKVPFEFSIILLTETPSEPLFLTLIAPSLRTLPSIVIPELLPFSIVVLPTESTVASNSPLEPRLSSTTIPFSDLIVS